MILRATQERKPDVLVMARHSYKPDGNFITRRLDALVEEFDHMTSARSAPSWRGE